MRTTMMPTYSFRERHLCFRILGLGVSPMVATLVSAVSREGPDTGHYRGSPSLAIL